MPKFIPERKTRKQLYKYAKKHKIEGVTSRTKKTDLIQLVNLYHRRRKKIGQTIPTFEDAVNTIKIKGNGYHKIVDNYYAFGEGWDSICIEDKCDKYLDDEEAYDECAWVYADNFTYEKLPREIKKNGFQVIEIQHIDKGWNVYGTSVALIKKTRSSRRRSR